jgi:head-tail adaptor
MTFIADKLKERVQVKQPTQGSSTNAGFIRGYTKIGTIWAEVKPIASKNKGSAAMAAYVRGAQISDIATHIMTCRRIAVSTLGGAFSDGQARSFNSSADLEALKNNYFIFRQRGGTVGAFGAGFNTECDQSEGVVGNLYKILGYEDVDSKQEYLRIRLSEVEEQGTGYPA